MSAQPSMRRINSYCVCGDMGGRDFSETTGENPIDSALPASDARDPAMAHVHPCSFAAANRFSIIHPIPQSLIRQPDQEHPTRSRKRSSPCRTPLHSRIARAELGILQPPGGGPSPLTTTRRKRSAGCKAADSCAAAAGARSRHGRPNAGSLADDVGIGFSWGEGTRDGRGLNKPPTEVIAQDRETPDLTQQPEALPRSAAIRQAEPFAANDYAEGNIGHEKNEHPEQYARNRNFIICVNLLSVFN